MKKGELKNRLRRRTADKLYDFDRSTGRIPAHLPAADKSETAHQSSRPVRRIPAKRSSARLPTH